MKLTGKQRIASILVSILMLVAIGFFAWRQTAAWKDPEGTTETFLERVERGMRSEDRAVFESQLQQLQHEWDEKHAKGERDTQLLLRLGNAYYTIGELKLAADQYRNILSTNPNDAAALENLGQTQLEMGDYLGAEATWVKAIDASPFEATYLRMVELINVHIPEQHARVKDILEHGITNLGQTYGMMIRLGDWYASEGQYDRAVSHYEVALQLNENAEARKQLEVYRAKWREQQAKASAQ